MKTFLQKFAMVISGVLQGFDRVVFKGKLPQLYSRDGMNCYMAANHILLKEFKTHAHDMTRRVVEASLVSRAKALERFRYLNSSHASKEEVARQFAKKHLVQEGRVCVLQCVEPCWTFDLAKRENGKLTVRGEPGKCSQLYHYYLHPQFGWMYVRLQTWFPFEIQVGINGREWLGRQMDREKLPYQRSDNKFLGVEDWTRAQQLLDEQLRTNWVNELNALQEQVHPLHPGHLGRLPLHYNWTVYQSEWATDVAFRSQAELERLFDRWLRQGFLNYDSVNVLRFLGRSGQTRMNGVTDVETNVRGYFEGKRIKHWVNHNSLKLYNHHNVLRPETTINDPKGFRVYRTAENNPEGAKAWRVLRRSVADLYRRAEVSQKANDRYLEALATMVETQTVKELAEPLTRRVPEPNSSSGRKMRGLNPLAAEDAALLVAVSDPRWMVNGLRNRDLVAMLYRSQAKDDQERRRRSAHATRLLRLLRAHGLLQKVPHTHRYQVGADARTTIHALLAARNANPDELTAKAA